MIQITEQIIPYKRKTFKNYSIFYNDIYFSSPYISKMLDLEIQTKTLWKISNEDLEKKTNQIPVTLSP